MSYNNIIKILYNECNQINLEYSQNNDGCIESAIKEDEYLENLESNLKNNNYNIVFQKSPKKDGGMILL